MHTIRDVRTAPFVALSLGVHVAVCAALLVPWRRATIEVPVADPAPALAGETFELPAPETLGGAAGAIATAANERAEAPADDPSRIPESPATKPEAKADGPHAKPPKTTRSDRGKQAAHPGSRGADGADGEESGSAGSAAAYGAVGERGAADLATAFTRSFPQAASADPAWRTAPMGGAGEAIVTLTIDESGHLVDSNISGNPSSALSSGIGRTLALIKSRPFVARGKTTRLVLHATVASDAVHDGLHGDVFAIGGSFTGNEGNAFFALAIGRRIDVRVRAK